ncbi:hypothetical protein [Paenibacillus sp.]|uniref:hypothetical protein n=1 Tax=Paenibacillus sp. TaxID=58172 RepID=UPI002D35E87E|nr:hypothetical protein [Paenibacillus sp.]HZG85526.1 hypothetical protein [Paenibacillus sp.]
MFHQIRIWVVRLLHELRNKQQSQSFGWRRLDLMDPMVCILEMVKNRMITVPGKSEHDNPATSGNEPVKLKMVHWIETKSGTVVSEINERFQKEYPNIEVLVEYAPVDHYQSIIRSRFHPHSRRGPTIFLTKTGRQAPRVSCSR